MFEKIKKAIVSFSKWSQKNWLALIIFAITSMLFFVSLIAFSWLFGYWSNALYGTRFELNSCWQGITAVVAGMGGIAALAKAAWTKYKTDSEFNSRRGEAPRYQSNSSQNVIGGKEH